MSTVLPSSPPVSLKTQPGLASYILHARPLVVLTLPVIYLGFIPFLLVDLFLWLYQFVCFTVYEIPKVRRRNYMRFDRSKLRYLNLLERFNCLYCSYVTGLFAYGVEVVARTEQHWCPIKHSTASPAPHPRHQRFLDFGDAYRYHREIETVRNDFDDLRSPQNPPRKPRLRN